MLTVLTGEDWSGWIDGYKRTGSALHRFSSSRQSVGRWCASSPTKPSYMSMTTETMKAIGSQNYNFMFQSLIFVMI